VARTVRSGGGDGAALAAGSIAAPEPVFQAQINALMEEVRLMKEEAARQRREGAEQRGSAAPAAPPAGGDDAAKAAEYAAEAVKAAEHAAAAAQGAQVKAVDEAREAAREAVRGELDQQLGLRLDAAVKQVAPLPCRIETGRVVEDRGRVLPPPAWKPELLTLSPVPLRAEGGGSTGGRLRQDRAGEG